MVIKRTLQPRQAPDRIGPGVERCVANQPAASATPAVAIVRSIHVPTRAGRGAALADGPAAGFPLVASERRDMSLARIIEVGLAPAASSRTPPEWSFLPL